MALPTRTVHHHCGCTCAATAQLENYAPIDQYASGEEDDLRNDEVTYMTVCLGSGAPDAPCCGCPVLRHHSMPSSEDTRTRIHAYPTS